MSYIKKLVDEFNEYRRSQADDKIDTLSQYFYRQALCNFSKASQTDSFGFWDSLKIKTYYFFKAVWNFSESFGAFIVSFFLPSSTELYGVEFATTSSGTLSLKDYIQAKTYDHIDLLESFKFSKLGNRENSFVQNQLIQDSSVFPDDDRSAVVVGTLKEEMFGNVVSLKPILLSTKNIKDKILGFRDKKELTEQIKSGLVAAAHKRHLAVEYS